MASLRNLKIRARHAAYVRAHDLGNFRVVMAEGKRVVAEARCRECGMTVRVTTIPAPNEAEIAGKVVAVECKGSGE
jgi:hypothetical protein